MKDIIINPADIESCWDKSDACMVKTKTGKVWVCEKTAKQILMTRQHDKLVTLPLKKRGGNDDK